MKKPPPKGYTLNKEQQEYFWHCLYDWQARLGISDWRITKSNIHPAGVIAMMTDWDAEQRQVACRLGLNWKSAEPTKENIEQAAVHELLHVLLYDVVEQEVNLQESALKGLEHRIINRLEKLLVPTAKDGA